MGVVDLTTGRAMKNLRWTSQDLEKLADEGKRYEIVDCSLPIFLTSAAR
jgi:hypothetical protein